MGAQGRQRALSFYDWKAIIPKYQSLWSALKSRRDVESKSVHQPYSLSSR